jgi:hypothetical protein
MKAITLQQPWASLVVLGAKCYETRSWPTRHRGMLLIHAGRAFPETQRKLAGSEPFRSALAQRGIEAPDDLPLGAILGAVAVSACLPADKVKPGPMELAFGDFGPGRWAWKLSDPCRLPNPISYKGNRGIFDVPDDFCMESGVPTVDISLAARVGRWFGLNT